MGVTGDPRHPHFCPILTAPVSRTTATPAENAKNDGAGVSTYGEQKLRAAPKGRPDVLVSWRCMSNK